MASYKDINKGMTDAAKRREKAMNFGSKPLDRDKLKKLAEEAKKGK